MDGWKVHELLKQEFHAELYGTWNMYGTWNVAK